MQGTVELGILKGKSRVLYIEPKHFPLISLHVEFCSTASALELTMYDCFDPKLSDSISSTVFSYLHPHIFSLLSHLLSHLVVSPIFMASVTSQQVTTKSEAFSLTFPYLLSLP